MEMYEVSIVRLPLDLLAEVKMPSAISKLLEFSKVLAVINGVIEEISA